jgi:hypothetical protein
VGRGGKEAKAEMSKQTLEAVQVQDAESWWGCQSADQPFHLHFYFFLRQWCIFHFVFYFVYGLIMRRWGI